MRVYEYLQGILGALGVGDDNGVPTPAWRIEEYLAAIYEAIRNGGGGGGGGGADLTSFLAPAFSSSTDYSAGDYVVRSGALYRFTADHAAGAWTGSDAEQTLTSAELEALYAGLANKANVDGSYISLTAGNAEQLVSDKGVTEKTPYLTRSTGGGASVGDRLRLQEIIGGTVAWNQAIPDGEVSSAEAWSGIGGTVSASDGVGKFIIDNTDGRTHAKTGSYTGYAGHKMYFGLWHRENKSGLGVKFTYVLTNVGVDDQSSTDWKYASKIASIPDNEVGSGKWFVIRLLDGTDNRAVSDYIEFKGVVVVDLTAMFGPTIADYLYTLESNTAGAGVAKLKSWGFCTAESYSYDPGSLLSVKTSAHKTFDSDNNVIGNYVLDDVELGGILKLDANNDLYYDGDSYTPDGTVTRRFGTVNLGALNWTKAVDSEFGTTKFTAANSTLIKAKAVGIRDIPNAFCDSYIPRAKYSGGGNNQSLIQAGYTGFNVSGDGILIVDSSKNDLSATEFKEAMNGKAVVYELATETTESADPYQEIQACAGDGTEQFVDGRTVTMPVGYTALYMADLRSKLESAPENPPANGDYIVRKTNSGIAYVPLIGELPTDPAEDGTYSLKVTVADGVATLSWEADT